MMFPQSWLDLCRPAAQKFPFLDAYKKTFQLIHAQTPEETGRAYRLRYKVYCQENGFPQSPEAGKYYECDRFEDRAENFILVHHLSGETVGTLRLILPNDGRPGESFPIQTLCDHPLIMLILMP